MHHGIGHMVHTPGYVVIGGVKEGGRWKVGVLGGGSCSN